MLEWAHDPGSDPFNPINLNAAEWTRIAEMLVSAADLIDAESERSSCNGEWIPCNERMPPNDDTVLIAGEGGVSTASYSGWWMTPEECRQIKPSPTHWRPLPKAPK